jgi:hypothetical protein
MFKSNPKKTPQKNITTILPYTHTHTPKTKKKTKKKREEQIPPNIEGYPDLESG